MLGTGANNNRTTNSKQSSGKKGGIMSTAGLLGIACMWLSLVFALIKLGPEMQNKDYRDYGAERGCYLNTVEGRRVYNWSLIALFAWIITQGSAMLKYTFRTREFFEQNDNARRLLGLVFVLAGQVYLGALFLIATHFEWAFTCNNYNDKLHGSNFMWASASLWILGVACMHAMPGRQMTYADKPGSRAIWRSGHEVSGMKSAELGPLLRK